MYRPWALTLAILSSSICLGQLTIDKPHYDRLIITEKTDARVTIGDLVIDTLIMETNSSLRFMLPHVAMRVNHAIVRKNVEWRGIGKTLDGKGGHGTNGVNLTLEVVFQELDRLVIDTRGGSGSNGENGSNSMYSLHGQNGGRGGDGGNINLRYRCNGFKPNLVEGKKSKAKTQAIVFKYEGGSGGLGGSAASTNRLDNNGGIQYTGRPGDMGDKGKNGVLAVEEM